MAPLVSVVMPVHNAAPFLDASVTSILEQTFEDFELIILDDASTDGSAEVLRAWAARDARIHLVRSLRQLGPVGSSNAVARAARGHYIARMDADDTCHRSRLARQLAEFAANDNVALVATLLDCIDASGHPVRPRDRWRLVRRSPFSPFPHGSIMLPRRLLDTVGGYRDRCVFWEDLDLYHRLARHGRILVVPEALCSVRFHEGSTRLVHRETEVEEAVRLAMRCMTRFRQTGDYDAELARDEAGAPAIVISRAEVLYSLAASRFWAGEAPGLLERLRPNDLRPFSPGVLGVALFALWGACHHRSLRFCMRGVVRCRDLFARVWLDPRRSVEWRFQ